MMSDEVGDLYVIVTTTSVRHIEKVLMKTDRCYLDYYI